MPCSMPILPPETVSQSLRRTPPLAEQIAPQPFLEAAHLDRHRRMAEVHDFGRFGETAGFSDRQQCLQVGDVHDLMLTFLNL